MMVPEFALLGPSTKWSPGLIPAASVDAVSASSVPERLNREREGSHFVSRKARIARSQGMRTNAVVRFVAAQLKRAMFPAALAVMVGLLLFAVQAVEAQNVILPLPPEDRKMIDAKLGAGVVGEALPCKPIDDARTYFPLEEKTATYIAITGLRAGQIEKLGVGRVTPTSGRLSWRCEFSPSLTGFIQQNEIGDLEMPWVSDLREGVIVITNPPMPFILKGMKPGDSRPFSQTVTVNAPGYPLWNYSGALSGTDTYVGSYRVTVPAGTFDTVLLRFSTEGQVGPAHTKDTAYYFFAAGEGLVAMISQENATAFWIIHINTSAGRVMRTRGVPVVAESSPAAPIH